MNESRKKRVAIYGFNIVAEAKVRTLVKMAAKVHPDWDAEEIEDFLKRLVGYAVEKELKGKEQ